MEDKRKRTLFIVDHDEAMRDSLRASAASLGWRVSVFSRGLDCLTELRKGARPDCLLLDLELPDLSGPDVQQGLVVLRLEVPVVAMTGQPESPLVQRAMEAGAHEVMLKPFSDSQFRRALERSVAYPR